MDLFNKLEFGELFGLGIPSTLFVHPDDIEANSLGQWTTLTNGHHVAFLDSNETGRTMCGNVGVAFLVSLVLADVVEIFPTDNDCLSHLDGCHDSGEDSTSDRHVPCERTFLVNVRPLDGFFGRDKAESNALVPSTSLFLERGLGVQEHSFL